MSTSTSISAVKIVEECYINNFRIPPETGLGWCGWSSGGCAGSDGVGIHMWTTNRVTSCETQ